jgi:hypothetical protein
VRRRTTSTPAPAAAAGEYQPRAVWLRPSESAGAAHSYTRSTVSPVARARSSSASSSAMFAAAPAGGERSSRQRVIERTERGRAE